MRDQPASPEDLHLLHDFSKVGKSFFMPVATPLQLELDGIETRLSSLAVGSLHNECLILKYPSTKGIGPIGHKLTKHGRITVRFISDGNVFAFQSEVIDVIKEPYQLIFVTYPSVIARHSLRNSKRLHCYLPAALCPLQTKIPVNRSVLHDVYDGIIVDISHTGCNFEMLAETSRQRLPEMEINENVILYLTLPGSPEKKEIKGRVKRIQRDTERLATGIQFNDIPQETKRALDHYISAIERFLQTI